MQVFLPHPSFSQTAKCLDNARLRKQQVEAAQIIDILEGKTVAWQNHPAVLQWKGYIPALKVYLQSISKECHKRGFSAPYIDLCSNVDVPMPPWMCNQNFHDSHKSRLLFKGRVDAVCYSLRSHLKVRSINTWLKDNNYPQKNMFTHADVEKLEHFVAEIGCKIQENWYSQFSFEVADNLPYWWPTKNGY